MSIEDKLEKLTVAVERLAEGVENLTLRIDGVAGISSTDAEAEPVKPEPEPVKPKAEPVEPEPVKPKAAKPVPAPVEEAMDPQPTFGLLDELRRVSIEMLKIDGKALREIYKRVGGSEKLSELPLSAHAGVIAAIAAWRKGAGK